ncbi:hypothetical protein C8F04DRAFT_1186713 [Mycena alexandri]|uniref:Uncharacterized protein n=1 Tax=Mycena alexandri TaxID=1745969 RepID=A0AAD6SMC6_9AGAR|nr:hypothetical protein C8F04DRAFT_1186713 [Mycena alexandri]
MSAPFTWQRPLNITQSRLDGTQQPRPAPRVPPRAPAERLPPATERNRPPNPSTPAAPAASSSSIGPAPAGPMPATGPAPGTIPPCAQLPPANSPRPSSTRGPRRRLDCSLCREEKRGGETGSRRHLQASGGGPGRN